MDLGLSVNVEDETPGGLNVTMGSRDETCWIYHPRESNEGSSFRAWTSELHSTKLWLQRRYSSPG